MSSTAFEDRLFNSIKKMIRTELDNKLDDKYYKFLEEVQYSTRWVIWSGHRISLMRELNHIYSLFYEVLEFLSEKLDRMMVQLSNPKKNKYLIGEMEFIKSFVDLLHQYKNIDDDWIFEYYNNHFLNLKK